MCCWAVDVIPWVKQNKWLDLGKRSTFVTLIRHTYSFLISREPSSRWHQERETLLSKVRHLLNVASEVFCGWVIVGVGLVLLFASHREWTSIFFVSFISLPNDWTESLLLDNDLIFLKDLSAYVSPHWSSWFSLKSKNMNCKTPVLLLLLLLRRRRLWLI